MATEAHVSLRLDPGIIEEIDKRAELQNVTRSKWIKNVIVEAISRQGDPDEPKGAKEKLKDMSKCDHPEDSVRERLIAGLPVIYCLQCGNRI